MEQNATAAQNTAPAKKEYKGFESKSKPRNAKYFIFSYIGIAVMFLFGLIVKPWGAVTEIGVSLIGIFLGLLFIILTTNELGWPAMVAMVALLFHGYYDSPATAIAQFFGNTTVWQFMMMQAMVRPLINSGAGDVLARMILTRKFLQKRPLLIVFFFFFAFLIAGNFMGAFGTVFLAFPILRSILTTAGYDIKDKFCGFMYTGTFISIVTCNAVKSGISAAGLVKIGYVNTALEGTGLTVSIGTYTVCIIVAQLLFMLIYTLCIKFVFRCDLSKLSQNNFREMPGMMDNLKFNKKQTIFLCAFLVYVLYAFFSGYIPAAGRVLTFLKNCSMYIWVLVIMVVLSFIELNDEQGQKKPIFNACRMLKEAVSWDMAFIMGAFTVLGQALAGKGSGVSAWLQDVFSSLLANVSSFVFVLALVALTTIVTNFFANGATGTIFATLGAALCRPFCVAGLNPACVAVISSLTASAAFLTYGASGPAPLLLNEDAVPSKWIWSYGVATVFIYIISITAGIYIVNTIA